MSFIFSQLDQVQESLVDYSCFAIVPVKPGDGKPSYRLTKKEKSQLILPEELSQILVGLLLGDLYAQNQKVV